MKRVLVLAAACAVLLTACTKADSNLGGGKSGSITRFAVHNNYMYVLDQNKVLTYSLANSAQPTLVNQLGSDYGLETIIVYDGYVYVGSRMALYILDIANPAAPALLSKTDRDVLLMGGCDPVVVKGNYAYSTIKVIENRCGNTSNASELEVFDVTDKTKPVLIDREPMNEPNGLGYNGNYLFVCDEGSNAIELFDISNPADAVLYASVPITSPIDLIMNGDKMVVSTKTGFTIFNVSNVDDIKQLGTIVKQ